jgi:hypothetical protein
MTSPARIGIAVIAFCACAAAQSNLWPPQFTAPCGPDSATDSAKFHLTTEQTVFQNLATSRNRIVWVQDAPAWRMHQQAVFDAQREVIYDSLSGAGSGSGVSAPINQNSDLTGSYELKKWLPGGGDGGIEWKPVSYLNLRDTGGTFLVTSDIGPFGRWTPHDVPFVVRGGISGSSWSTALRSPITESSIDDVHGDAGGYGGVSLGDAAKPFLGVPLHLTAEAFGRSIKNVGLGVALGSALFRHTLRSGDSVFVYYADTLTDGKERKWSSNQGQQSFFNTPWRIDRSLQASGALRGREHLGFSPSIVYSYSQKSISYPTDTFCNDVKILGNTVQFLLGNKEIGRAHV